MPTKIADVGADALREAKSNLDTDYVPGDDEEFMNERQQEYFRGLLLAWKKSILSESESTLAHLQDGPLREPDLADRAPKHRSPKPGLGPKVNQSHRIIAVSVLFWDKNGDLG